MTIRWDAGVLYVNGREWARGTLTDCASELPEGTWVTVRLSG